MSQIVRFGISADESLLERFDALIADKGYSNRSEAIRDLMRNALVEEEWRNDQALAVGTVTLVYDHHSADLADKLTEHQHDHHDAIISSLHVHLDAHHCLEVVILRGKVEKIGRIASELIVTKGVKHGKFVATTTGEGIS